MSSSAVRATRPRGVAAVVLGLAAAIACVRAAVVLPAGMDSAGVRYAVDRLQGTTQAAVATQLGGGDLPAGLAEAGPEAFWLAPAGDGFRVAANTTTGLMYGLLELRDRLQAGTPPTAPALSKPALRLRGDGLDFPFYLGVDLYNGRWRHAEKIEGKADSWWLDRSHWAWRLRRCADLRTNALLIAHPHPFPALIEVPRMPEAAYFPPEHLQRLQEHFTWILDQAEQYGVKVYFLTWNIWVSPGLAKVHGIPQEGPDGELVREYTRRCYRTLFDTYPKLAGIMTMAGEAPPGCVAFVRQAIVQALNDLPTKPELLFWIWCSYPEDAKVIFDDYKGRSSLVHYLQYEQLFRPQADPRIRRASEELGGVPVVTLGGLGTATGWLYWSDPYYLRDILADLPRQNGDGCFFQGLDSFEWAVPKWLGWDALARYGWDPSKPREDEYWQACIGRHYGVPEVGPDYLTAAIAASSVPTRLLALLHRQTDHFMPQFGLPLVHYLGLPTLSTYVFENHERIDERGRLAPRLGLTWPNPDWGEKVVGIVDFVQGATDGTPPPAIADELQRAGVTTLDCVNRLRPYAERVSGGPEAWRRCLDQLEMNAHLGVHTAEKIRAAIAWERWRRGQATPEDVLAPLSRSVDAFDRLAEAAGRVYPGIPISTFRSAISRPPPWTHLQIWNLDQWRQHDFATSAAMFHRELAWVQQELTARYPQPLLPYEDDLGAQPEGGKILLTWDFEGEVPRGLRVNNFPPKALAGSSDQGAPLPFAGRRLVADHQGDGFWFPLATDPTALPLQIGRRYWVRLDYWIVRDVEALGDWLSAGARTTAGGWQQDFGARYLGGPPGTRGRITLQFTPHTWTDLYVYVSLRGPAKVEFDNLEIWEGPAAAAAAAP